MRRTSVLCVSLARLVGLSEGDVWVVRAAALLHDVGNVAVAADLLSKPGLLSDDERLAMQRHASVGEWILKDNASGDVLPLIRWHHECWDGTGYPDGLQGEEIPLGARVLALCSAFDAMRSIRPWRAAMTVEESLDEVRSKAGTQFDPALVDLLLKMNAPEAADGPRSTAPA